MRKTAGCAHGGVDGHRGGPEHDAPDSTGATRASLSLEGNHTITLTVTDSGQSPRTPSTSRWDRSPANDVTITSPEVLAVSVAYYGDEAIEIEGLVTDKRTGTPSASPGPHGWGARHDPTTTGPPSSTHLSRDCITLTATDDGGGKRRHQH